MWKYRPPYYETDIRAEQKTFGHSGRLVERAILSESMSSFEGSTFLMRSISFGHRDILVAGRVEYRFEDGSVAISWRALRSFQIPKVNREIGVPIPPSEARLRLK